MIVAGGQTGVDRAALDAAAALGLAMGGWCPRGRRAEDGPIPEHYPLRETATGDYPQRTRLNVLMADATLVLSAQPLSGGTALTARYALQHGRPCLVVDPTEHGALETVQVWLSEIEPMILNVAGPRESQQPGAYGRALPFLRKLLMHSLTIPKP
jgi:hypothetical protein